MDGSLTGSTHECPFNSPMLVAERYFQMKNLLAVTLKAEMAGLDDSSMNRAYRDLVNLFSRHREEISNACYRRRRQTVPGPVWRMKSNRLQPRMPFGVNQP